MGPDGSQPEVPAGVPDVLSPDDIVRRDALADRISRAAVATFDLVHVYLGERLGLFRALADGGPATPPGLAARTGLHERYVREWLEQGAVAGILTVDRPAPEPAAWRYALPEGHAAALLDPDSLRYATPTALSLLGSLRALPQVADLFRSGGGLTLDAVGEDLREGEATGNRPQYLALLGGSWLSAIPGLDARLRADPPARVLDVGMGLGWSSIAMALAYPRVTVDGLDLDEPSVLAARRNADQAGVAERVRFECRSASDPGRAGPYDLVTAFECIHDMSDPVGVLAAMRASLAAGGLVLVADEKADETFTAPGDELQRYLYGWSVLHCLPAGMDGPAPAGTGGVMRPATLRRYALAAGFRSMEILPIDHRSWRFYLLRP
jgi:SAM-dependent methyltransferase